MSSQSDVLIFDMSQAPTQSTNVFVKKDYFTVQDDAGSAGYSGNQSVLQLSSLANSNRYMDFKNSYITMPLVLTLTADSVGTEFAPFTNNNNFSIGLKNWFGHVIHSVQVDYNNSTAQQLTSFQSLLNCFKLHTSLSWDDVATIGSSIGYYPDNAQSWGYKSTGLGLENNKNKLTATAAAGAGNNMSNGNEGLFKRQSAIAYDPARTTSIDDAAGDAFSSLCSATNATNLYRSYVYNKINGAAGVVGVLQIAVTAKVMSKHISDFFAKVPLVKGAFIKVTMNLNQPVVDFTVAGGKITTQAVNSPLGGVNPLMVAAVTDGIGGLGNKVYKLSLGVGRTPPSWANHLGGIVPAPLATNVEFHTPAVVFAPAFETAYLSSSIKRFEYEDFYNYNVVNRVGGSRITELLTNGVKNQTKLVVMPFLTAASNGGTAPIQSSLTTDGATCSPVALNDFNILLSGASLLQSNYRYSYEMFMEQLRGAGAINGGMTDGLTSGIIDQTAFENNYGYMCIDTSRMLDIERDVPKSVQLLTQIQAPSGVSIDLYTFICYKNEFAIDVLTGSRV